MSLLDEAHRLAKEQWTPVYSGALQRTVRQCNGCEMEEQIGCEDDCPWRVMRQIVAVLEAAERLIAVHPVASEQ